MITIKLIGLGLIVLGIVIAVSEYREIQGKTVTLGIASIEVVTDSNGETSRYLWVAWKDLQGNKRWYKSAFSSDFLGYGEGDPVRIDYDRKNPAACGVLSFGYRFGVAWFCMLLGTFLVLLALGYEWGNPWLARHFPVTIH